MLFSELCDVGPGTAISFQDDLVLFGVERSPSIFSEIAAPQLLRIVDQLLRRLGRVEQVATGRKGQFRDVGNLAQDRSFQVLHSQPRLMGE